MDKVYTLRVVVELISEDATGREEEGLQQLRSQELTGDLTELQMMVGATSPMVAGMTYAVINAELRRHEEQDLPY